MSTDLTFFTNEPNATLLERFRTTFTHVQYLDILVGYFRTSGFHLLYDALEGIEKIRILVGLTVDRRAFEIIDSVRQQQLSLGLLSHAEAKEAFADQVETELAQADDTYQTELGIQKFIAFLKQGKLEIKAHPSQAIHAKLYIQRFPEGFMDYGRIITGSSNFSYSGLQGQYEFNVELTNRADVAYALDKFELLWAEAVDLSEAYVATVEQRSWLNDKITPYQLYLKFLYEYFKEEINADSTFEPYLPPGFMDLAYQKQAVISAKRILDSYGGVFLADVVGLGKTFISALLAQQFEKKHILIICPPVLKTYWKETFDDFHISGVTVESLGKLNQIIEKGHHKYHYVFVDEAHRFRNEKTQQYEMLHKICWGKKVILVSATPFNNRIDDIESLLKLFQAPRKSDIPGVRNLDGFFSQLRGRVTKLDKSDPTYLAEIKAIAREVRMKILAHVMYGVPATRSPPTTCKIYSNKG